MQIRFPCACTYLCIERMNPNRDFIASDVKPVGVTNNPTTSVEFKIPPFGDFFSNEAELGNKGFAVVLPIVFVPLAKNV